MIERGIYYKTNRGILLRGDCLDLMRDIQDESINMVLCDLPYGTTDCKWDKNIPINKLWTEYNRIIANNGVIVLFASQPFTSLLITSNLSMYKYNWVWKKTKASNFLNAKLQPLKIQEDICVFSKAGASNGSKVLMKYNPQGLIEINKKLKNSSSQGGLVNSTHGLSLNSGNVYTQKFANYPNNILEFKNDTTNYHPTQKPVALCEYLIKTYSDQGDVVLDNASGSGTTAIACEGTDRKWICIEKDEDDKGNSLGYCDATVARLVGLKNSIKL